MRISMIAAMAANRVIGQDNRLPWRLPADLRWFKAKTVGHTLIMGRKTYDSIGRPLPWRRMVVITRQEAWRPEGPGKDSVLVVHSLDEALAVVRQDGTEDEVFIAGGGEIFQQALPIADRIYLTRIGADFPGDAFFPELDAAGWHIVEQEHHDASEENPYPFTFETMDRTALDRSDPVDGDAGRDRLL
jgi:dihydrofolate reductase